MQDIVNTESGNRPFSVTVDVDPAVLKSGANWGMFNAVILIISGGFTCLSIIGIPFGVFNIIGAIRLMKMCENLKAYANFEDRDKVAEALINFQGYAKFTGIQTIVSIVLGIILYAVLIVAIVTLSNVATDFFGELGNLLYY